MRRMVAVTVGVCCVLLAGCDRLASSVGGLGATHDAETRVRMVLSNWQAGADGESVNLQTAICEWDRGVALISDVGELGKAHDAFEAWRAEKGYAYRAISTFEITGTSVVAGTDPPEVRVDVVIDGTPMAMLVQAKERIRWAR